MRVETNEKLVRRNRKIAQYLFFVSFGVPLLGLLLINQQAATPSSQSVFLGLIIPVLVLPVAYVIALASVRLANLWVRLPRPEVAIQEGLKGVGSKSVLYNYFYLPARHVLIAPQGVFAIVTRYQDGEFSVDEDRWVTRRRGLRRILGGIMGEGIGNPTQDAQRAAEHVRALLAPIAPDVTVQPVIVFVDPRAHVSIGTTAVPVVYAQSKRDPSLKDLVRDIGKQPHVALTPQQIEAFEQATLSR